MKKAAEVTTKVENTKELSMADAPNYISQETNIDIPAADSAMPFPMLKLLQQLSPELDEDDTKYIEGAQAGDLCITNGVKTTIIDGNTGITFSPVLVRKVWTEWIPRKQGGGFVASYNSKEECEAGFTVGNEIVISIDYLIITPDHKEGDAMVPVLLQFNTPTKMGVARQLQKYILQYKTMTGVQYTLNAKKQANKAGQKFYNFSVTPKGWTPRDLYIQIENLRNSAETLFLPAAEESPY